MTDDTTFEMDPPEGEDTDTEATTEPEQEAVDHDDAADLSEAAHIEQMIGFWIMHRMLSWIGPFPMLSMG